MARRDALVGLLLLALSLHGCEAGFSRVDTWIPAQTYLVERFAVYLKNEPPFGGYEDPFMRLNVSLVAARAVNQTDVSLEVLIVHADYVARIGYEDKPSGSYFWCCSAQLMEAGVCSREDKLILSPEKFAPAALENKYKYLDASFIARPEGGFQTRVALNWSFTAGGMYSLYLINCAASTASGLGRDISNRPPIQAIGETEWRNPYGYLSGSIYGYLALYWFMAICYFVFGLIWAGLCLYYRKDLMGLQIAVLVVTAISFVEMLCWAIDYLVYNGNGLVMLSANIIGTFLSSSKAMLSRLLLLLVAFGYSISTNTLERGVKIKLTVLMVAYFVAEAAYRYMAVVEAEGKTVSLAIQAIIVLAYVVATAAVWAWSFFSLFRSFHSLKLAKQWEKAALYRRLLIVLGVAVIVVVAMFLFQIGISIFDTTSTTWRVWVLWDVFWELIFFAILVTIGILWRPHPNNRRYAYSIQVNDNLDDSVAVELESQRAPDLLDASEAPADASEVEPPAFTGTPRVDLEQSNDAPVSKPKRKKAKKAGSKRPKRASTSSNAERE